MEKSALGKVETLGQEPTGGLCGGQSATTVAVHHRAAPFRDNQSKTLVQLDRPGQPCPRAADAIDGTARKYSNVPAQQPAATTASTLS